MALSSSEKTEILYLFGWPGKTVDENSKIFNRVVDDRLKNILPETETKVKKLLKRIQKLEERIDCAADRVSASKIDDVTLNPKELRMLREERLIQITELSDLLNIAKIRSGSSVNVAVVV